jgi:hypothetical protein
MAAKLNEGSEFTIPLKNLVALVAFTGISVWGYFGITERLSFIEHELAMIMVEVEENDTWIDEFEPPKAVQTTILEVADLKTQMAVLQHRVEELEKQILDLKIH